MHKELKGFLSSLIYLEIDFRTIEEPESQCLKITKNLIFEKSKLAVKVYILCVIYFHVKINDFKSCDFLVKILELQKSKQMLRIPVKKSTILKVVIFLVKILEVEMPELKNTNETFWVIFKFSYFFRRFLAENGSKESSNVFWLKESSLSPQALNGSGGGLGAGLDNETVEPNAASTVAVKGSSEALFLKGSAPSNSKGSPYRWLEKGSSLKSNFGLCVGVGSAEPKAESSEAQPLLKFLLN